mgnify:CR=1 FL=1
MMIGLLGALAYFVPRGFPNSGFPHSAQNAYVPRSVQFGRTRGRR